jgi:two-component system response regulator FixJ
MQTEEMVYVIDDDEAARDSLRTVLTAAGVRVETYPSAVTFLSALPVIESGTVVSDVRMLDMTGIELLQELKRRHVDMPVILLTGHGDVRLAVEAMKLGADDFFEKPFDPDQLLHSVQNAASRRQEQRHRHAEHEEVLTRFNELTGRERQVLDGLFQGHSNKMIANQLQISPRTVEVYRANLMTKMRAESLSELVRMALLSGLMEPTVSG